VTDQHVPRHAAEPGDGEPGEDEGGLGDALGLHDHPHTHRHRKRSGASCLVMLVVLGLLLGAAYVGLTKGVDWAKDRFADPEDYPGPGTGSVLIEVKGGDSATAIAHTLEDADVVASAEAFIDAAKKSPQDASGIQVGFYPLKLKMKATDALAVLADPANIRTSRITLPEGMRVVDVVDLLVDKTGKKRQAFLRVLDRPRALGLPGYANGNAEGYLFPATYGFAPNETPAGMLKMMVDRWRQSAEENDLETRAEELGYKPAQIMTIASLVEAEGRGADMPKIARVIYNRLENPGTAGTIGRLQIDASVNYGLGQKLGVALTSEQLAQDTPYNTYTRAGLPPTPIEAPGDEAIRAALNPSDGDWYYYVTVDLRTGETKFAETPEEFATYKAEYQTYCQTSDAC
jgi:UPF0755 protein